MNTTVYYELWQMECCGTPFKIGDSVEWYVIDADRLISSLDIDGLQYAYDAHFDDWNGIYKLRGIVNSISVYYEKYELVSAPGHDMLKPVPGISEMVPITSSEDVDIYRGELQASGYVVELIETDVRPAKMKLN